LPAAIPLPFSSNNKACNPPVCFDFFFVWRLAVPTVHLGTGQGLGQEALSSGLGTAERHLVITVG